MIYKPLIENCGIGLGRVIDKLFPLHHEAVKSERTSTIRLNSVDPAQIFCGA